MCPLTCDEGLPAVIHSPVSEVCPRPIRLEEPPLMIALLLLLALPWVPIGLGLWVGAELLGAGGVGAFGD